MSKLNLGRGGTGKLETLAYKRNPHIEFDFLLLISLFYKWNASKKKKSFHKLLLS